MTICNSIGQSFTGFGFGCTAVAPRPQVNQSVFYNRTTNINQTFINNENANLSIRNNITVNNFNQYNSGLRTVQPGFRQRIGQFFGGYKQPVCGYKTYQPKCGYKYNPFKPLYKQYNPINRFFTSFANKFRSFMDFRVKAANV